MLCVLICRGVFPYIVDFLYYSLITRATLGALFLGIPYQPVLSPPALWKKLLSQGWIPPRQKSWQGLLCFSLMLPLCPSDAHFPEMYIPRAADTREGLLREYKYVKNHYSKEQINFIWKFEGKPLVQKLS